MPSSSSATGRFGKTWSTFLHLAASPNYGDPYITPGDNFMRRNQIRYTQSFGNGLTFSIAIEDPNYTAAGGVHIYEKDTAGSPDFNPGVDAPGGIVANDRNSVPDVVASVNWAGDWGQTQISGAIHGNEYTGGGSYGSDSEIGFALLFGLVINVPSFGDGSNFQFKAIYTDGASQYHQDTRDGILRSVNNVVWGRSTGADTDSIIDTVQIWSVLAAYTHNWSPTVATTFGGSYANVDNNVNVGCGISSDVICNAETDLFDIFANVTWSPIPRLDFMIDVHYMHSDTNGRDQNPEQANTLDDSDGAFSAVFQVTRNF